MYPRKKAVTNPWEGMIEPFEIVPSVYFVGTYQASTHLIDTGDGLVLIDPGYSNALYLVIDSIRELGFNPRDIRYIINTHWHGDHTQATRALAALSGAKTLLGEPDLPYVRERNLFEPDILVKDGDTLTVGDKTFTFLLTPGHTKGTISPFFDVTLNGKTLRAGMFGGAGANTLDKNNATYYDGAIDDYLHSLDKLEEERVDVFIGNHTWNNNTEEKARILKEGGENPFIDSAEYPKFLAHCRERCLRTAEKNRQSE